MAWAAGTVLNDKYIIAKEIGNGGFGLTYLAYKSDPTTKVAIKTLKDAYAFDPILHDEFRKEILSLSKCNHPQIVTIEDFGDYKSGLFSQKSQPYMVMEYIKGQTVYEKMRSQEKQGKSPQFSENDALFYIRQVALALVFAHDRHPPILHRDLKPQNIMLREDRPEAVLIDFGLAKNVAANPVSTDTIMFSSHFAPIEQYSYKSIRLPATDVYGLAAALYYMLTAKVQTDANDRAQGKPLINPKQYNPNISEQNCQAIIHGLAFNLEDRPQTMQKWLDLLPLHKQISSQPQTNRKSGLGKANSKPEKVYEEASPKLEAKTASEYFNSAYEKSKKGDKEGAISDYNEAIRLNPNYATAYMTDPLAEKIGMNVQGGTVNVQNLNIGIAERLAESGDRVRILVVAANPLGSSPLKLDHEVKTIQEALRRSRKRDNFVVEYRLAATPSELRRALLDVEPHVLHFSGHGAGEQGLLFVSDESAGAIYRSDSGEVRSRSTNSNEIKFVPAQPLANLSQLCDEHLECVVLNACYSDVQGNAISANIPFTIGMRDVVEDNVAIKFSQGFYDAIGAGKGYEIAFKWGKVAIEFDLADDEAAKILVLRKNEKTTMTSPQSQDNPSIKQSALENVRAGGNINVTIHQAVSAQSTKQNLSGNIQQQMKQRQIDTLKAEVEAISNQWESALSDEQRLQLQKRLDQKLKQLGEFENG